MMLEKICEEIRSSVGDKFFVDLMLSYAKEHREIWKKKHDDDNGSPEYLASMIEYVDKQMICFYDEVIRKA